VIYSSKNTYACIVGIENYDDETISCLYGPRNDAIRFARFLRLRGVPAENIWLFVNQAPKFKGIASADIPPIDVEVREPNSANIQATIREMANWPGFDLWFHWGGHGLMAHEDSRYLLTSDATREDLVALDLRSLIRYARSYAFDDRLTTQTFIFDACAEVAKDLLPRVRPLEVPPPPEGSRPIRQFQFFASRPGEMATNYTLEQTGALSNSLLKKILSSTWPPDIRNIARDLISDFERMQDNGYSSQVPTYVDYQEGSDRIHRIYTHTDPPTLTHKQLLNLLNIVANESRLLDETQRIVASEFPQAFDISCEPAWADIFRAVAEIEQEGFSPLLGLVFKIREVTYLVAKECREALNQRLDAWMQAFATENEIVNLPPKDQPGRFLIAVNKDPLNRDPSGKDRYCISSWNWRPAWYGRCAAFQPGCLPHQDDLDLDQVTEVLTSHVRTVSSQEKLQCKTIVEFVVPTILMGSDFHGLEVESDGPFPDLLGEIRPVLVRPMDPLKDDIRRQRVGECGLPTSRIGQLEFIGPAESPKQVYERLRGKTPCRSFAIQPAPGLVRSHKEADHLAALVQGGAAVILWFRVSDTLDAATITQIQARLSHQNLADVAQSVLDLRRSKNSPEDAIWSHSVVVCDTNDGVPARLAEAISGKKS